MTSYEKSSIITLLIFSISVLLLNFIWATSFYMTDKLYIENDHIQIDNKWTHKDYLPNANLEAE